MNNTSTADNAWHWRAIVGFQGQERSQKQLQYPKVTMDAMGCCRYPRRPAQNLEGLEPPQVELLS